MSISYFKLRDRFDFSKDSLDIGIPLSLGNRSKKNFLRHLFNRIFSINESRFDEFYLRHFDHYTAKYSQGDEEDFFKFLWEQIEKQLKALKSKDVYDKDHATDQRSIGQLELFTNMLIRRDRWNFHKLNDDTVIRQQAEITRLKAEVETLKAQLQQANKHETKQYIDIPKGRLLTLINLCVQLGDLKVDGKELLFAEFPIVWVKLICKYFREDHQEIDFERVRRYFPKDRRNPSSRSGNVPPDHILFEIKASRRK